MLLTVLAHQHNEAIQSQLRWFMLENTGHKKTSYRNETQSRKANNAKHSKTKLPWFSYLLSYWCFNVSCICISVI